MSNMRRTTLLSLVAVLLSACAATHVAPLSVPLAYAANPSNASAIGPLSCNAVSLLTVRDARTNKLLGTRTLEGKPDTADVSIATDPVAWVHDGVQHYLSQNGVSFGGSGPQLALSLDSLTTSENVWHRSSYRAGLALTARLQSASGKVCWQNTSQGKGSNYGYSGSTTNYQETLDEALDDATQQMASLPAFKDALCHCGE
jgi:hypothetical protein